MNFNWVNTHKRWWSFRYKFIHSRCNQFHVLGLKNEEYLSKMCLVFTRTLYLKRTKFCAISLLEFVPKRPNENAYWYKKALVGFSRCHFSIPLLYKNLRWLLFSYNHVTNKVNHHTYQSGISYNNWIELLNKMLECNHSNGINQLVWFFALWEIKSSTFCLTISAFSFFFTRS